MNTKNKTFFLILTCLLSTSVSGDTIEFADVAPTGSAVKARTLEFIYTADEFGRLGSFTMEEADLLGNIGQPFPGYVSNALISELSFSHNGLTWGTTNIDRNDQTIFSTSGSLPMVVGGNGALAQRPNISGQRGAITIFSSFSGTKFGGRDILPGTWSTVVVVPEPPSALLVAFGSLGLAWWGRYRTPVNRAFGTHRA